MVVGAKNNAEELGRQMSNKKGFDHEFRRQSQN
jgi:hypothetical protein